MSNIIVVPQVVTTMIDSLLVKLERLGCQFDVVLPNGAHKQTTGYAQSLKPTHTKKRRDYGGVSLCDVYMPHVEHLEEGGVALIECGQLPTESVRSAVTAWCSAKWGKKSYTSAIEGTVVQILRMRHDTP